MKIDVFPANQTVPSPGHQFLGLAAGLLGAAIATIAGLYIGARWGNEPVVLLYIPPVLAVAAFRGLWPSLGAAVASTLAYNYYFTAPLHTLQISNTADVVTVTVLFLVALVTSQLAGKLREQARLAAAHANRNATIAGFARRLLSCASRDEIGAITVSEMARLFQCNAVLMSGEDNPQMIARAPGTVDLAPSDVAAAANALSHGQATGRGVGRLNLADWQFRPIRSHDKVLAALGMARIDGLSPVSDDQVEMLESLLDQIALALERARLEREARDFAALHERDRMRNSLLASIGTDVKPRLNAISAAAREMRRSGSGEKALVASVASEVVKLDRYVDSLVDLSPGADPAPIVVGRLTIDLHQRMVFKDGAEVHLTPKEFAVLAELARHAGRVLTHSHLLLAVWGPAQTDQIEYLRVAISALRKKLEDSPAQPRLILNEPAVGYRLMAG